MLTNCPKHGKTYPCGPCRIESSKRPPQAPVLPLEQLKATVNEVNVVSDAFGLVRKERPRLTVKRKRTPPKSPTAREQYNLSRRQIGDLLEVVGVAAALLPHEQTQYRDLAAGNLSELVLAQQIGMKDAVGVGVYIGDLETRIIRRALFVGVRLQPQRAIDTDTFDRTVDGERAREERAIDESDGKLIGGSLISRGYAYGTKPGTTFRGGHRKLDSFERSGRITTQSGEFADRDFSRSTEHDDYGEESGS